MNNYIYHNSSKPPTSGARLLPVMTSWLLFLFSGIMFPRFLQSPVWYFFSIFPIYSSYFALYSKHERFVSSLHFDDSNDQLIIRYSHFKNLNEKIAIPYVSLSAKYGTSLVFNSNWRIDFSIALSIYDKENFVCELRYLTKKGWSKKQVECIYQEINKRQKNP